MSEPLHIVGFSGGIDSQACARWVLNRYGSENTVLMNSNAGGNEHPLTTDFIEWYSQEIHPVSMVSPIFGDMGGFALAKRKELGVSDEDPLTFDLLAKLAEYFPTNRMRFCTQYLKLQPQKRVIEELWGDLEVIRYSGVRRDESRRRKGTSFVAWDDFFDCELCSPIADWTKKMCFDYVKSHGEKINELYTLGFGRVGCAPCVGCGKEDIRAWADRFPEMIDKVRVWERTVGRSFFHSRIPGRKGASIDEVVEWSKTVYGGRQVGLHVLYQRPACESKHGLCE